MTPTTPPSGRAPVNLSKVDLLKRTVTVTLEKKQLSGQKARVAVVIDASGSMAKLYSQGTVQRAFERALAVAACLDDDGSMDVWFFANKCMRGPSVTERDFDGYVQRVYPAPKLLDGLGSANNEPVVMRDVIRKYTVEAPDDRTPVYVMFFSDGGIRADQEIAGLITETSRFPIFWQFIGIGQSDYGVLQQLDTLPGRFIDNANFFSLDDLEEISDEEIYARLLNEFPDWLVEARRKGVLRP